MKLSFLNLTLAFLAIAFVSAEGATVKRISKKKVESATIKQLLPAMTEMHKLANENHNLERELTAWTVALEDGEVEWVAIRQLVDKANSFASFEEGEEQATAYKVSKPTWQDVATAADFSADKSEMSKELQESITSLRNRIVQILAHVDHLKFYKIFSSNESQGHHGFVLYNQQTEEALYVSSISDH